MSKVLVIPDIHCMLAGVEEIMAKERPNQTIFTGDYFDSKFPYIDLVLTGRVAEWLKLSVGKKDRIHLLGNHELFYVSSNDELMCGNSTEIKLKTIKDEDIPWNKFKLHHWIDDSWLVTHAGLSNKYYTKYGKNMSIKNFVEQESSNAMKNLLNGQNHRLFSVSSMRGGYSDVAGSFWCDVDEFEPIPQIQQIFGHTRQSLTPKKVDEINYCIDCDGCYAIYENGKMELKLERK